MYGSWQQVVVVYGLVQFRQQRKHSTDSVRQQFQAQYFGLLETGDVQSIRDDPRRYAVLEVNCHFDRTK